MNIQDNPVGLWYSLLAIVVVSLLLRFGAWVYELVSYYLGLLCVNL